MHKIKDILTVVIPSYNEKEELLRKAIESILNQTYSYIELILVNDGSTDNTPDVMREYQKQDSRVKVFDRKRNTSFRTVSEAFNIGLENATGKWWHHDAADCWHDKEWAERCMYALYGQVNKIGCHTDFAVHKYDGTVNHALVEKVWKPEWSSFENYRIFESLGGMVFRMDIARRAGKWDTRFPRKQTREWTLRVLQQGDLVHIPVELWHFVFHEPDQMKNIASVKYRLLGDIKNGYDLVHNAKIALASSAGRFAMADAFRTFFTAPEWSPEREKGVFIEGLNTISNIADIEASETWGN
jgi:glycosyltransferase involved in cell wall biosynthesis